MDTYESELVDCGLIENSRHVELQLIVHKPAGQGPFPLMVFNHGSTGNPGSPAVLKEIHTYQPVADHFVNRGWMVVVPHRRGRGGSGGFYGEGLDPDGGYSCDPNISLSGADRALCDLSAAMQVLLARPDVDDSRVVVGGHSRGGILSVAYAGTQPKSVAGVVSFVGGWISDQCHTALQINSQLACKGVSYLLPTLWLAAGKDEFYSIAHVESVFGEYFRLGGVGELVIFESADHRLLWSEVDWRQSVNAYMVQLGHPEFAEERQPSSEPIGAEQGAAADGQPATRLVRR